MLIAHLSDTHVGQDTHPEDRVRRVLDHLSRLDPPADVVLITGDLVDHGTAEEYEELSEILAAWPGPAPLLTCPGNHDSRTGYAGWRGLPEGPLNEVHRVDDVVFLMLDSVLQGPAGERIDSGELSAETLRWLDEQLDARSPGERAVVCLHHPPLDIGMPLMDPIRLRRPGQLAAVLERHVDVVAVLTGHAHTPLAAEFAGVPLRIPGAVASTTTLPSEQLPMITDELPPMVAFHQLDDDLVTHWRALA